MKFQVGDKVLVKHTGEEAEVVDLISKKMVMLESGGVRFPAYIDQLDFPYFKRFTGKKAEEPASRKVFIDQVKPEKRERLAAPDRKEEGMWLSILPITETDEFGDEVVETLKLHLVNRTSREYRFSYKQLVAGEKEFELQNKVHAFESFYLHDIAFEVLNDNPNFSFDFAPNPPDPSKAEHFESSLRLKPKQVFARLEELRQKGEATFSWQLFDQYPDRTEEEFFDMSSLQSKGYKIYDASKARQHLEPARHEIDLHIEALAPDHERMDNFEKLTLQLRSFEKYLDLAIAHHQASLIVIHGVGSGKLRDEIHELLRLRKEVKSFVNRYHPAYGYGATEIFFQY